MSASNNSTVVIFRFIFPLLVVSYALSTVVVIIQNVGTLIMEVTHVYGAVPPRTCTRLVCSTFRHVPLWGSQMAPFRTFKHISRIGSKWKKMTFWTSTPVGNGLTGICAMHMNRNEIFIRHGFCSWKSWKNTRKKTSPLRFSPCVLTLWVGRLRL